MYLQNHSSFASIDFSAAFKAMCVEHSRGGPSGHLNSNINGGNCSHKEGVRNYEDDNERALTYHEFIAATMINR